jgi:hypothetical protein
VKIRVSIMSLVMLATCINAIELQISANNYNTQNQKCDARYESPVPCRTTSKNATTKAPAPILISKFIEDVTQEGGQQRSISSQFIRHFDMSIAPQVHNNPTDSC